MYSTPTKLRLTIFTAVPPWGRLVLKVGYAALCLDGCANGCLQEGT